MKSVPPRGNGWILPVIAHVAVLILRRTRALPRGGTDFVGRRLNVAKDLKSQSDA